MHEGIRLNFVRLNIMLFFLILQNYPWSTVNWNSDSNELKQMHLIIWRRWNTNDEMIPVGFFFFRNLDALLMEKIPDK